VTALLVLKGCNAHATLTRTAAGVVATPEVFARAAPGAAASEVAVADVSEQNATRRTSLTSASRASDRRLNFLPYSVLDYMICGTIAHWKFDYERIEFRI